MIIWYSIGLLAASLFIYLVNRYFDTELIWGDIAFILILGVLGPLTAIGLVMVLLGVGLIKIHDAKFWKKPVFKK